MLPQHLSTPGAITDTIDVIRQGGDIEWAVYHVNIKDGSLIEDETGTGIEDMVYVMEGDKVQFGYLRYEMDQTNRFVCICWCGQGAPEKLKKAFVYYSRDWEDFLKKNKFILSVTISARSEDELEESVIVEKLNKSTNTFVRAKKTGEAKEDLKGKASNFWSQQQQKDAKDQEEYKARQQAKERDYAESKRLEAERMNASAAARNQQRIADKQAQANAFKAEQQQRDEEEKQRWKQQQQKHEQFVASRTIEPEKPVEQKQQIRGNVSGFSSKFNQMNKEEEKPQIQRTGKKWVKPTVAEPVKQEPPKPAPRQPWKPKTQPAPVVKQPEPEPEPVYEEPVQQYEEPVQEQQYEQPVEEYQEPVQEQPYEEPVQEQQYEEQPQEQYQEPVQEEQPYEEPVQEQYQEQYEQQYEEQPAEQYQEQYDQQYEQPQGEQYRAAYDYEASAEGDLTFAEGEILYVLSVDEDGWAQAVNVNGEQGTVPLNYLEKM